MTNKKQPNVDSTFRIDGALAEKTERIAQEKGLPREVFLNQVMKEIADGTLPDYDDDRKSLRFNKEIGQQARQQARKQGYPTLKEAYVTYLDRLEV